MEFKELLAHTRAVRQQYEAVTAARGEPVWNHRDHALAFVGDVGDVVKLVMAMEGSREIPDAAAKLPHDLVDCLWAVMAIADCYGIDLDAAFHSDVAALQTWIAAQPSEPRDGSAVG